LATTACGFLERGLGVQAVADELSISVRKFRNDFRASVGLAPKAFARIRRLQRALRQVARESASTGRDWAHIAATSGYFDQAHMVHEFRRLTGSTPSSYLPRSADEHNHAIAE